MHKTQDQPTKYHVHVPDVDYYQAQIKCQAACPVRTDARGYVTAMARGNFEEAYNIARDPNPLASICGRICNAPCEAACRRGSIDAPVAIRPLKRVVTEHYGVEAQDLLPTVKAEVRSENGNDLGNITRRNRTALQQLSGQPGRKTGRVAIIGSGPAGLGCAHDLAILGHAVTIFEAAPATGGMLRLGVPLYRLERSLLDQEIESILNLGVDLHLNTPIGRDITFAHLRRDFDAVFIAAGLGQSRSLNIPGADHDGVLKAVDFLLNVNMGYKVELGQKVIIIGGGSVAIDAARTALRYHQNQGDPPLQSKSLHAAIDVARTALRMGVADISMIALEAWDELPAGRHEIDEALQEGIRIFPGYGPHRIITQNGTVEALETLKVASVFDETGRFNPQFLPNTHQTWPCDTVILAIGQAANLDFLGHNHNLNLDPSGLITADPQSGATNLSGVFAGGDVVYGPRILIEGVGDGQRVARAIDGYLQGAPLHIEQEITWTIQLNHTMPADFLNRQHSPVPTLPLNRRIGIAQVETGYDEAEAIAQAQRCLQCGINTIFDAAKCILCNGCVDVCPWNCLKIVNVRDLLGNDALASAITAVYGLLPEELAQRPDIPASAMIKDDDRCTRCGLCAQRCPTGAITMETFSFQEKLSYHQG